MAADRIAGRNVGGKSGQHRAPRFLTGRVPLCGIQKVQQKADRSARSE